MPESTCSIDGCDKPGGTRTWCDMHYARWKRHGDPTRLAYTKDAGRIRTCPGCGDSESERASKDSNFCRACWNRIRRERRAAAYAENPTLCRECSVPIASVRGGRTYCSLECKRAAEYRSAGWMLIPCDVECARDGCDVTFTKVRAYHIYCSKGCGLAVAHARRMNDPAWRDEHYEQLRRWVADNPGHREIRNGRRRARLAGAKTVPISPSDMESRLVGSGSACWMCGAPGATWDHVKPLAAGGPHMLSNLRRACVPCNSAKGGKWNGTSALHSLKK